jgi:cytochrome P450
MTDLPDLYTVRAMAVVAGEVSTPMPEDRTLRVVRRVLNLPPFVRRPLATVLRVTPIATAQLIAFMVSPEIRANPWSLYAKLRRKRPVLRVPPGIWLVSKHQDVAALARDQRLGVDEHKSKWPPSKEPGAFSEGIGKSMLFLDPPDHERLRRLVARSFTPRRVEELRPRVEALTGERLDKLAAAGRGDLMSELAYPLPIDVICEMLGVPQSDRHLFPPWARALAARLDVSPFRTPEIERAGDRAATDLSDYLDGLLADASKRVAGGLIGALADQEEEAEHLSHDEVIATCALLLIAGYETTANLIGNGTLALLSNPAQLDALRTGTVTPESAVDELLRYDAPVQMTQRIALEDIHLHDHTIEKGDEIVLLLGAANRDPDEFADPDTLNLGRQPNHHLAFSYGIHACLGASLARLEAGIVLQQLVRRFPTLRLDGTPKWRETFVLRGLQSLPLAWD